MVLILLGNFARSASLKFEIISLKTGLVSSEMEHDTRELLCRLERESGPKPLIIYAHMFLINIFFLPVYTM